MSTQKHDSGVRRSELGVSREIEVVEGKIESKCYRCGGVVHLKWECPREIKPRFAENKPHRVENPTSVLKCCNYGQQAEMKGYRGKCAG